MGGYIDQTKLLQSLTEEDIVTVITTLGSSYKKDNQGNVCCSTSLCHNGDSPYKLVYYSDSGLFKCYTCGDCYNIVELVIRARRNAGYSMNYYKALRWIASTCNKLDVYGNVEVKKQAVDFSWINRILKAKNSTDNFTTPEPINENVLDVFTNLPYKPWVEEGISYEAQNRFEIGYFPLNNSITIPHRNRYGELIGVRQRYLDDYDIENIGKYTPVMINGKWLSHSLGAELYGLWVVGERIKNTHRIILVEAEKSVMQAYSMYGTESEVAATCGSSISSAQIKMILKDLEVNEVLYAPDRDYHAADSFEAEAWYNTVITRLKGLIPYCKVYLVADRQDRLGYKQSPTDMGKEIFETLLNEKIEITKDELKRVETEKHNGNK